MKRFIHLGCHFAAMRHKQSRGVRRDHSSRNMWCVRDEHSTNSILLKVHNENLNLRYSVLQAFPGVLCPTDSRSDDSEKTTVYHQEKEIKNF